MGAKRKLLVIDGCCAFMDNEGSSLAETFEVLHADSVAKAMEMMRCEHVSAVLLDLALPDLDVIDVVRTIHHDIDPHLPVIVVAEQGDHDNTVEALSSGACDFVPKSSSARFLSAKLQKALERRDLEIRLHVYLNGTCHRPNRFVFRSSLMKRLDYEITRVAELDFDVLIVGETGVGKDLIASELHARSSRADKPFIPTPIATLSETLIESELFGHERGAFSNAEKAKIGKFEAANGGTIYIPEISSLSENVQLKLLYFMQYKSIIRVGQDPRKPEINLDIRLVMATNRDPAQSITSNRLREDFYHRMSGVQLYVPPLRERIDDIEPLAEYFLTKYSGGLRDTKFTISADAMEALKNYRWPGNVRELENSIKHALAYATGPILKINHFPHLGTHGTSLPRNGVALSYPPDTYPPYRESLLDFKKAYFQNLWQMSGQKLSKAAQVAQLTPRGIRKILDMLNFR